MKGSKDILSSALKTAQMGQVGIRCAMQYPLDAELHAELCSQLEEYNAIEHRAHALAFSRGWTLEELNPALKSMAILSARMRLRSGNTSSKTAAMVIRGNTAGMIKSLKNLHQYPRTDQGVTALAETLLNREKENIIEMQDFV